MDILESLKSAGFKPTLSEDGMFKPLKGTYEAVIETLRPEIDQKNGNAKYYQLEIRPSAVIEGDSFGEKFLFRKRIYVDGDKSVANLQKLLNDLFTCGVELDLTSTDTMEADFSKAIGVKAFIRSWGWKPEGKDDSVQMFSVMQEKAANKKKKSEATPF